MVSSSKDTQHMYTQTKKRHKGRTLITSALATVDAAVAAVFRLRLQQSETSHWGVGIVRKQGLCIFTCGGLIVQVYVQCLSFYAAQFVSLLWIVFSPFFLTHWIQQDKTQ